MIPLYLIMLPLHVLANTTTEFDILHTPRWMMALEIVAEEETPRPLAFHMFARIGVHRILGYIVGFDISMKIWQRSII